MIEVTNQILGIGIPLNWPMLWTPFFDSFVVMDRPDFKYIRAWRGNIDDMRNELVTEAQRLGCTHLIMMDTDMIYPKNTIVQLLSHRLPVVGGLCFRRYPPFTPLTMRGRINNYRVVEVWNEGLLAKVDATGTGCVLFDIEVFDKIKPPWFKFRPNPNKEIGGVIGEDIGFCPRLKRAGYELHVDTSIEIGHLSTMVINRDTYELYKGLRQLRDKRRKEE